MQRRQLGGFSGAAAANPDAKKCQADTHHAEPGCDHVSQNADVGIGRVRERVKHQQSRKEKKLAIVSTTPDRLIQLRKGECRSVFSFLASVLMAVHKQKILLASGGFLHRRTFFTNTKTATALFLESAHVGDESFDIVVTHAFRRLHQDFPSVSLKPSLMALKAESSLSATWTFSSV